MPNTKYYVSKEKLGLYDEKIKGVISAGDAASLQAAKDYADESFELADGNAASLAATAESNAKAYTDTEVAKANGAAATAQAAADTAQGAAATAQAAADTAQGDVDALEAYVGTFTHDTAKSVVEYINAKTDGIATSGNLEALGTRVTATEGDIATIKGDYLKAADKTELAGDIADVQAAVDAEAARADAAEKANAAAIKTISDDYLKAADKTELQGNIDTLTGVVETLRDGIDAEKVDGVKDLIAYVEEHGTEVTGMQGDIAKNAGDIADVAGRMTTAEGNITTLQGDVAKKVDQTAYDAKIAALEGEDTGIKGRLDTIEGKLGTGDGSVESKIATAKQEAIDDAAADADEKDAALKTEIEAAYKQYADDEDAKIELRVDALEADTHTHDNKALLDTYTQTEADLADAVTKKHEHTNGTELAKIVDGDVAKWNAAEGNAKTFAQGLNDTMSGRVDALETWHTNFTEVSEDDINALFA